MNSDYAIALLQHNSTQLTVMRGQFNKSLIQWLYTANWDFIRNNDTRTILNHFIKQQYNAIPAAMDNSYIVFKKSRYLIAVFDKAIKYAVVDGKTLQQPDLLECLKLFNSSPVASLAKYGSTANIVCRKLAQLNYKDQTS